MNVQNLAEQILSTPDGGTIRTDGHPLPKSGYFIGGAGRAMAIEPRSDNLLSDAYTRDQVGNFLRGIQLDRAMYVGWWTDSETGKLWLDTTTWTANYNQAEQWTTDRGEIAFWDIARAREFRPVIKANTSA